MTAVRLVLFAVLCLCAAVAAQDYKTYTPGKQVKRWTTDDPLTSQDEAANYAQEVGVNRVAPVIIVGVLCFIGILIWSCCRCCGKCRLESADQCCAFVLGILLAMCAIAGLALIIVGLEASKDQDTAFNNVPIVVDSAVQWVDDLGDEVSGLLELTGNLTDIGNALIDADNGTGIIDNSTVTALTDAADAIRDAATEVDNLAEQAGIEDFQDSFAKDVDEYNEKRRLGVNIVLGLLLGLVLLEVVIAFLNGCAGGSCKPKKNFLKYFTAVVSILSIIILLILWIVAAALVGVMTGLSDVCIDPDTSILGLADISDDVVVFFVRCDEDPSLNNPFADDTEALTDGFDEAQTAITELHNEITNSTECTQFNATACDTLTDLLADANSTIDAINTAIGVDTLDASGNAQDGLLQLVSCDALNSRYHLVLNVMCGDAAEALGKSTEVIIGFAVLYVVVLILTRLLTDVGMEQHKKHQIAPEESFA